jgi:hypothetical protein
VARICHPGVGEKGSPTYEGTSMSYPARTSSNSRIARIARLTDAVRKSWTEARYTDRRLMELRTHLSRHVG